MAIGDAVSAGMGTAEVTRQPSAGVEEKITSIIKEGATDIIRQYNGSTQIGIMQGAAITSPITTGTGAFYASLYLLGLFIDNSTYLRKTGTTDIVHVSGVQTNA